MKRILLAIFLILPVIASADPVRRNESQTTIYSTEGDLGPHVAVDRFGNQIILARPASPANYWSSCSSTITGTSRTAIKTGVASTRLYTYSVTCSNSGASASIFNVSDAGGAVQAVGALAATVGSYTATFPVPLRGTAGNDLSVTLATASTSTICCANGYTSAD